MTAERQTSDARRASRLAFACALGSFAGTRLSGGRGLRCAVFRLRLHRLGTAPAASAVSRFRWLFGGVGDLLERGATLRRSPAGQYIALQPRVVPAGRLQRALGDGELDALALKARVELIDAPFGLGRDRLRRRPRFGRCGRSTTLSSARRARARSRAPSTSPPRCSTVPSATPAPARARGSWYRAHREQR